MFEVGAGGWGRVLLDGGGGRLWSRRERISLVLRNWDSLVQADDFLAE